jgi:hypothetical protein
MGFHRTDAMQLAGDIFLWFLYGMMAALIIVNVLILVSSALGFKKFARDMQDLLNRCAWFLRLGNSH